MRSRAATRPTAFVFLLLSVAATVCYRPTLIDCKVRCEAAKGCPTPLACVDGWCTRGTTCVPDGGPDDLLTDSRTELAQDTSDGVAVDVPARADVAPESRPTAIQNLVLWLDPETDLTLTSFVSWLDRSGQHHDATSVGSLPTLVPAADGRPPMLDLSGSSQYLSLAGSLTSVGHIFIVAAPRAPAVSGSDAGGAFAGMMMLVDFSEAVGSLAGAMRYGLNATERLYANYDGVESPGTYQRFPISGTENNLALQLFEVRVAGDVPPRAVLVNHFTNGMDLGYVFATAAANTVARQSNLIGGSNSPADLDFQGRLGEIVIYNRPLLQDERLKVEAYLLDKWRLR